MEQLKIDPVSKGEKKKLSNVSFIKRRTGCIYETEGRPVLFPRRRDQERLCFNGGKMTDNDSTAE